MQSPKRTKEWRRALLARQAPELPIWLHEKQWEADDDPLRYRVTCSSDLFILGLMLSDGLEGSQRRFVSLEPLRWLVLLRLRPALVPPPQWLGECLM